MKTKNGKLTIHQPRFCYFVGFLIVVKTLWLCFCSKRERGCVDNHPTLVRLIGRSSHHLDMERLIGRSAYLFVEGQICLPFG
mgnify:CR=1 FL=1